MIRRPKVIRGGYDGGQRGKYSVTLHDFSFNNLTLRLSKLLHIDLTINNNNNNNIKY